LEILWKVSFYVNKVVVVAVDDELHNFLVVCILIGIDNSVAFICFGNYSIVANELFFDLVQDFLFFFIKKYFVLSAAWYLIYSCSDVGSWLRAVSASDASILIQFLCL
jgi:hypothetical protein